MNEFNSTCFGLKSNKTYLNEESICVILRLFESHNMMIGSFSQRAAKMSPSLSQTR